MVIITNRNEIKKARRIIIKIGTSTLINNNSFNSIFMENIAEQIKELRKQEKEVIIVASGAVGLGMHKSISSNNHDTIIKQCFASIGQNIMMRHITDCFSKHSMSVSQILVNHCDILGHENKDIKNMINTLLEMKIIPIINQNDAISKEEITKYDNDTLSANIGNLIDCDLLILLTDVDGLYKNIKTKELLHTVTRLNSDIYNCITLSSSTLGRGGMQSKINAAQIMKKDTIIVNGNSENILMKILDGEKIGTHFSLNGGETSEDWTNRIRKSWEIYN
ncbi:MAG: glutamate 5-kinase [Nanoarchaeota archaeon]